MAAKAKGDVSAEIMSEAAEGPWRAKGEEKKMKREWKRGYEWRSWATKETNWAKREGGKNNELTELIQLFRGVAEIAFHGARLVSSSDCWV